jgi:hypothetical protein
MAAFVAATCAVHVASFGESRFHLPIVPVLAVGASLGGGSGGPSFGGGRAHLGRWRVGVAAVVMAVLGVVWVGQAGELLTRLDRLRAPDGWRSALPY